MAQLTYDKFLKEHKKLYPSPAPPDKLRWWHAWKLVTSLFILIANLILAGLRTYEVFSEVAVLGALDPIMAVITLEVTIGVGISSLQLNLELDDDTGKPKRPLLYTLSWFGAVFMSSLVSMFTNAISLVRKVGLELPDDAVNLSSVVAMGLFVPLVGVLHAIPLNFELLMLRFRQQAVEADHQETLDTWTSKAEVAYHERLELQTPEGQQKMTRQRRQNEIWSELDRGVEYSQEKIRESADYYGVTDSTIRGHLKDYPLERLTTGEDTF